MPAPVLPTQLQRRTINLPIELRSKSETEKVSRISGYSARYYDANDPDTQYQLWSDCFERLMPGCFESALKRPDDVRCLFNHDPSNILGRTAAGTCRLRVDSKGLWFEADLPDSEPGRTVETAISRKDVTGCSFSFDVIAATWIEETKDGETVWIRQITDVVLYDVGPVTFPAYKATDCDLSSVRSSLDNFRSKRPVPSGTRSQRRRWRMS